MYESTFGTEWEALTKEEAIRRAFAVGVAESLGATLDDELDRIVAEAGSAYDRNIVDLAYEEGRNRARKLKHRDDDEAVWSELVSDDRGDSPSVRVRGRTDLPGALDRIELIEPPDDDLDRLRLPGFLRRS